MSTIPANPFRKEHYAPTTDELVPFLMSIAGKAAQDPAAAQQFEAIGEDAVYLSHNIEDRQRQRDAHERACDYLVGLA